MKTPLDFSISNSFSLLQRELNTLKLYLLHHQNSSSTSSQEQNCHCDDEGNNCKECQSNCWGICTGACEGNCAGSCGPPTPCGGACAGSCEKSASNTGW